MYYIIALNGPPRSGKDTFFALLESYCKDHIAIHQMRYSDPIKRAVHASINKHYLHPEAYADEKDIAHPDFFGYTPREMYIWLAEQMKKRFGSDIFSKIMIRRIRELQKNVPSRDSIIVITDLGFDNEAADLALLCDDNTIVSIIQLDREGCDFEIDSRDYVDIKHLAYRSDIRTAWLENPTKYPTVFERGQDLNNYFSQIRQVLLKDLDLDIPFII